MELKEYLNIFKKNIKTFILTVAIIVAAGFVYWIGQPANFKVSLTLNITRIGHQQTDAYRYDDYYRLQADEKFADTVVRWLESPRIATDVYNDAKINADGLSNWKLSRIFKAQRLSSQIVQITYITANSKTAEELSRSIIKILNEQADKLNEAQKEENWFKILGSSPVVRGNKFDLKIFLALALALGIFLGMWAVFIKHYFNN